MGNQEMRSCFISSPLGTDTKPLREALSERGIAVWESSDLVMGSAVFQSVEDAISNVDFVCAVIPTEFGSANVFFELGMAAGTGRPSLVFVAPKADLPAALRGGHYARASINDPEALRFHLEAFVKNAGKGGHPRVVQHGDGKQASSEPAFFASAHEHLAAWEAQLSPPLERDLVLFLAGVFEAAGYVASASPPPTRVGDRAMRADLAIWIDELQATVGNPLVIEVETRQMPTGDKIRQLQHLLLELRAPLGLLVCWDPLEVVPLYEETTQPLVITMSVRQVVDAIDRRDFPRTLLARRNAAVHRAA